MDPIVLGLILLIVMPIAVIWALSKSAALRGPMPRPHPRRPVQALVTEVIPEEHPEDDEDEPPNYGAESPPPAESGPAPGAGPPA